MVQYHVHFPEVMLSQSLCYSKLKLTQIHVFGLYGFWIFQKTRSKSGLSIFNLQTFSLVPSVCFFKLNIMWFTVRRLVLFRFQGSLNNATVFVLLCIPCLPLCVAGELRILRSGVLIQWTNKKALTVLGLSQTKYFRVQMPLKKKKIFFWDKVLSSAWDK